MAHGSARPESGIKAGKKRKERVFAGLTVGIWLLLGAETGHWSDQLKLWN
jgi:hypothetical protein